MIVCGGDVDCISDTKILAMAQSVGTYSGLLIFRFYLRPSIRQSE